MYLYPSLTLLIFFLFLQLTISQNYTLALHSTDRGALCLDGSPAGLYYHLGKGANKNKFMIYFDSGGFCKGVDLESTLQNCYKRSKSSLGSTKRYLDSKSFDNQGLLSTLQENNPVFWDWTKIFIIYCDGSEYQGMRKSPIKYKDEDLYFRGLNNTLEQFHYLDQTLNFYNGEEIVLTGVSAGGMATYFYSNYVYQRTVSAKVYAIPDSGLFITNFYSQLVGFKPIRLVSEYIMKISNEDGGFLFPECLEEFDGDVITCQNTANIAKYLKAPMFIIESPYDAYSIENIVLTQCQKNLKPPFSLENCNEKQRAVIEEYRGDIQKALAQFRKVKKVVGLWAPSCAQHGFTDAPSFTDTNFRVPTKTGPTVSQAIRQFLDDPENPKWIEDTVDWPGNSGCSGTSNYNSLRVE